MLRMICTIIELESGKYKEGQNYKHVKTLFTCNYPCSRTLIQVFDSFYVLTEIVESLFQMDSSITSHIKLLKHCM